MKKLTTLLMALMLMSAALWADETITVSANSSDISEGLDLKVVAKLFAEAKNLEEFETMLNNPDSAFCNLDLNGDGEVDYLRVVETGEGNKRLIVLQAILAKDIYQDVASIYVEKDESDVVSVQVIGDEYVYGTNYIIEPVYVYRPVIYDWFWSDAWYAWHSPWYWGYWPGWWYAHSCWAHDWYWHHCYAWHHHHHWCSFRPGHHVYYGYHELRGGVSRRDYATANPERSFERRNAGLVNAREIRGNSVRSQKAGGSSRQVVAGREGASSVRESATGGRTYGSSNTAVSRSQGASVRTGGTSRSEGASVRTGGTSRSEGASASRASASRASASERSQTTATRSSASSASTRSTGGSTRSTSATASRGSSSSTGSTYSKPAATRSTSGSSGSGRSTGASRSTYSGSKSSSSSSSSSYGGSRSSGSSSYGSSRSSGSTYSGGSSRGGGGSYGGGSRSGGGGSSRGGSVRR